MTSRLSWIAFVPFALLAFATKVVQMMFLDADGMFMGLSNLQLSYIAIGCSLFVFIIAIVFAIIDKKTAPVYLLNRNLVSGLLGFVMAVLLACDGANRAYSVFRTMDLSIFNIADVLLTILCAVVFVVLGLNHFVGNGGVRGLAVFYLIPTLWSALRLISCFLKFTTVSITITDVTILACYIFATLFLFNYAMIVSVMKGRSPVKSAFIYGLPAVIVLLSYGMYEMYGALKATNFLFFSNIEIFELLVLGMYILTFVIELTFNVRTKDEIEYITDGDGEEYDELDDPDSDIMDALSNSITNGNSPDKPVAVNTDLYTEDHLSIDDQVFIDVAQNSMNSDYDSDDDVDTSDFIYGAIPNDDEVIMPIDQTDDYTVDLNSAESADGYISNEEGAYSDEEVEEENLETDMDRIDKLILEISGEESV